MVGVISTRRSSAWLRPVALVAALALAAPGAVAADALWTAQADSASIQATAFGTVAPRAVVALRAGDAGVVQGLAVRPGDTVAANAVLGRLVGPSIDAVLVARQSAVDSAAAALQAAQKTLAGARENKAARLATQSAVASATADAGKAEAELATARAQLDEAQDLASLKAPQAGQVLTVQAAAGERVDAGQTVLTLEPANDLALNASFYGAEADAIRPGMTGEFASADGGTAIPVKVRAAVGALQPDGGRVVELTATGATPSWINGEVGTVTITTGTVSGVTVPTSALVLDEAHWWVLVHTAQGDQPQSVTLGPSRGPLTLITKGLTPGAQVVVANAYLEFHRGISSRYQPPD